MALTSAEAEVRIVPSMRNFGNRVRAGVKATRVDPLEIQVKLDRRSLDQAEQAARQAAANVAKARDTERRASEDLRLAEVRLAEARQRSAAGSSTLIAAENRLEQAKRAQVAATTAVQRAHADEARSTSAVVSANERLDASYRRLQRSTHGIAGAMRSVRAGFGNISSSSVDETDRALTRATSSALRLGAGAAIASTALVGVGSATGPVLALAGALVSAAGSAALIPAGLAGAGASFGALKLGVSGVSDALSAATAASEATGESAKAAAEKADKALAKLAPHAREFVRALLGMKGAWDAMQRSVQDRLFAGTSVEVKALGDKYIPILDRRLGDIARSFNYAALETSRFLRTSEGVRMVDTTLANTSKTTDQLARAAAPLTNIFMRFSEIGSAYLPGLARGFADAAERAATFVNSAEGAAKIRGWIENGLTALRQLWELLKNVGGIGAGVFRAMNAAGTSTMQMLVDLTGAADRWVNSVEGQRTLVELFTTLRNVVEELKPGVGAVLGALKDAFMTLAPSLPGAARALSNIAEALAPIVGWIAHALKWLIDEGLIPLGEWARKYPGSFQAVAVAIIAVVLAVKALNIAKSVMSWATGIGNAFGVIRRDADKASDAVGRDGKSGLRGRLDALKKVGKITIGIALVVAGLGAMNELGEWIKQNNPGQNKAQADRTVGEEAQAVAGGVLSSNPFDAFKNRKGSPFEIMFGQTPDQFADSVKNSMFGKLSEKFDNSIGQWMTDHISTPVRTVLANIFVPGGATGDSGVGQWLDANVGTPVRTFFTNLPVTVGTLSDQLGMWAETNIRQPVVRSASTIGAGVGEFFRGIPAWIGGISAQLGVWAETNIRQPVVNKFTELKNGAIANVTETRDWVNTRFRELKDWIILRATEARDWVSTRYNELKNNIIARATEARDWVHNRLREAKDWIIARATEARDWVSTRYNELKTNIIARATEARDWVHTRLREAKDWIIARATEARDWVSTRFNELKTNIIARATEARDWVHTRIREAKDWIIARATEARDWVHTRFRELKDWIVARATEARDWVHTRIRETKDWIIARATEARDWVSIRFRELKDNAIARVTEARDWVLTRATELKNGFSQRVNELVDSLRRKWDELRAVFAHPIKWVIDQVWNGTIANLWGKARALLPGLPEFQRLATGGPVRGPGGPTADRIPTLLSDNEHVLTAREVKAAGGHGAVEQWRRGLLSSNPAQFATGGPVKWNELWDTVKRQFPTAVMTSNYRKGDPGEHGAGLAIDVAGPMAAINRWIAGAFPDSHELIYTPGINLFNGRPHTYNAGTRAEHNDHVHWARAEKGKGILGLLQSWGAGASAAIASLWETTIGPLYDSLTNPIRDSVKGLFPSETLPHQFARGTVDLLLNNVRDVLFGASGGDQFVDGGPTSGDQLGNARVIGNVARGMGLGRNAVVIALATALQESGLRNINYGDRDSVGLFQQRPSQGWGSVAQIMNPSYSASKFFNALKRVAGWERMPVTVAAQRVQRSAFPNAYAKWVGKANQLASQIGFSDGGVIPGRSGRDDKLALVQGGERVLTTQQNEWLESALRAASVSGAVSAVNRGAGLGSLVGPQSAPSERGPLIGEFHAHETVDVDRAVSRVAFLAGSP